MTQEQQETLNEIFLGKEDPDMAFKKPMTNKLKEEIDDIVFRCFEQGRYWGTGIGERIADQDYKPKEPIDRTEAVKAILTLINQKEKELLKKLYTKDELLELVEKATPTGLGDSWGLAKDAYELATMEYKTNLLNQINKNEESYYGKKA